MKVIIAGSCSITEYAAVREAIDASGWDKTTITELVSGGAKGPDRNGESWARGHNIPIKQFLPDWNKYGRSAGPLRNCEMGRYADALIALWDGNSRGTKHMIAFMQKLGKPVYVHLLLSDLPLLNVNKEAA